MWSFLFAFILAASLGAVISLATFGLTMVAMMSHADDLIDEETVREKFSDILLINRNSPVMDQLIHVIHEEGRDE